MQIVPSGGNSRASMASKLLFADGISDFGQVMRCRVVEPAEFVIKQIAFYLNFAHKNLFLADGESKHIM